MEAVAIGVYVVVANEEDEPPERDAEGNLIPEGEADFNRVTALCSVDPDQAVREVVFAAYDEAAKRFAALLRQALPQLSQHDFQWRLECMYGAMMYIRSDNGRVSRMLGGGHRADPVEHVIDELVAFTAAGFRAAGIRAAGPRAAQ